MGSNKETKTKKVNANEAVSKESKVADVLKDIKSNYGNGSIMILGEKSYIETDTIPSGSILLDEALGVGGYPKGRIIEIYGPESSGKTTLALEAIAAVQKNGGLCAFIDVENTIDPEYSENIGIQIDKLVLSQPDSGEEALEIVEHLTKSACFDLIVVDSVAALVPQSELVGNMVDASVGLQARMMSKALRKITGVLSKTNTTIIFINQLRDKVGVIYGNNETTTGGRALKFYASIRMDIRRSEAIKEGINVIGNTVNIKIVKNKVAPPFKSIKLDIIYGKGISKEGELLDLGIKHNLITKSGAWYDYKGERMGQGRETAKKFLMENPNIYEEIKVEVIRLRKEERMRLKKEGKINYENKLTPSPDYIEIDNVDDLPLPNDKITS